MACFLRASNTRNLLVENCVTINGMGEGLRLGRCPDEYSGGGQPLVG